MACLLLLVFPTFLLVLAVVGVPAVVGFPAVADFPAVTGDSLLLSPLLLL
jgi:hypothetical protein